jgi:hypothetical protein
MFLININWMGTSRSRVVNPTAIKTIHSKMASKASNVMRGTREVAGGGNLVSQSLSWDLDGAFQRKV